MILDSSVFPLSSGGTANIANTAFQGVKDTDFTSTPNASYEITASCKMTLHSSPTVDDKVVFFLTSTANFDITSADKFNGSFLATDYIKRVEQLYIIIVLTYSGASNGWVWDSRDNSYINNAFIGSGITFNYVSPGDTNGIMYYLGATKYSSSFDNPHTRGEITATSSSSIDGNRTAPKAFTRGNNGESGCWHSGSLSNQWLQIQFNNSQQVNVTRFELWASNLHAFSAHMGSNCLFQAWDGITWITLLTFNCVGAAGSRFDTGDFNNNSFYNLYRIFVPGTLTHHTVIGDVEFYGTIAI